MLTELPHRHVLDATDGWQGVLKHPNEIFPQGIYPLDPELSGVVLYAKNKGSLCELRNAYGSQQFTFHWTVLAQKQVLEESITCSLPIAKSADGNGMKISHRMGKQAQTKFQKQNNIGKSFTLWSAETHFIRPHQIRIHAYEVGIPVLGESLYNTTPIPSLSDLKSHVKENRKGPPEPIYDSVMIHLSSVSFPLCGNNYTIDAPLPDTYAAALKIIERWS
ncbi:MAG: hypothetical protein LW808_004085 [Verrucomicrobiota bacterium]|nr:MAG: hypothetical protein LW808_004085 [Verrucomicrobiota bacterium]